MARVFPLVFYNLRVGRPAGQVEKEVRAILNEWRPAVLGLCEATDYDLPGVEDYVRVRDSSKPGRENVAAYVKASLELAKVEWHDLKETWTRTAPGATGQHPPRSILELRAGPMQCLVHHQPPKGTDNVHDSQQEGIAKLTSRMAPWTRDDWDDRTDDDQEDAKAQPRVVLWDANRGPTEDGPGPKALADKIDGKTVGDKIDGAVVRKGKATGVTYTDQAGNCALCTDHPWGCFKFKFELPA